jgi:hypothetical protein
MNIWNMSYNKRVTDKIRSLRSPLIMGRRERAKNWVKWRNLKRILGNWIFGGISEKGSTRKRTENRVTRWSLMFWGNSAVLRWIAKRFNLGEFKVGLFLCLGRGSTWAYWGGGAVCVSMYAFGGILCVLGHGEGMGWTIILGYNT